MFLNSKSSDGDTLSGRSISVVFQNAGDVSFESAETGSSLPLGKAAHAIVSDDRTNKTGHMFLVYPDYQNNAVSAQDDLIDSMQPQLLDRDFVFEVMGHPSENVQLSTVYKLAGKDGPVDVYVDALALQLLESAETVRTDEAAKKAVFDEIDDAISLEIF